MEAKVVRNKDFKAVGKEEIEKALLIENAVEFWVNLRCKEKIESILLKLGKTITVIGSGSVALNEIQVWNGAYSSGLSQTEKEKEIIQQIIALVPKKHGKRNEGKEIPVQTIKRMLEQKMTSEEIIEDFKKRGIKIVDSQIERIRENKTVRNFIKGKVIKKKEKKKKVGSKTRGDIKKVGAKTS